MGKKGGKKNGRRGGTVHGKTPFGTKAKKKQLQERRARKAERPTGRFAVDASSAAAHHGDDDPGAGEGDGDSAGDGGGTLVGAFGVALGEGQNTLTSLFYKESDRDVARRREAGNAPLAYGPDGARDAGPSHGVCPSFYSTMEFLPHPRRPAWSASSSRSQLEADERAYFKAWLAETAAASRSGPHARDATPFFEQNLEVWRQLWRVLERSDVVLLVADVRCPLFYIPIPLIRHIGEGGFKCQRVVVVLTKCDLVSPEAAQRWQDYLTAQVPGIATVQTFSTRGGSGDGGGGEGGGKSGGGSEEAAASEGITSRRKRFRRPGFKRDHPLIQCQVRRILAACTDGLALPLAAEGANVDVDVGEGGDGVERGDVGGEVVEGTEGVEGVEGVEQGVASLREGEGNRVGAQAAGHTGVGRVVQVRFETGRYSGEPRGGVPRRRVRELPRLARVRRGRGRTGAVKWAAIHGQRMVRGGGEAAVDSSGGECVAVVVEPAARRGSVRNSMSAGNNKSSRSSRSRLSSETYTSKTTCLLVQFV